MEQVINYEQQEKNKIIVKSSKSKESEIKKKAAVELRKNGYSEREIANKLGIPNATVHFLIKDISN